ncbi:hypothetical protein W911_11705 [Hyphomicrobium nitrativorans NL23]|uniref:Uncharacterized protein n=1 Tax=Hyphomicrobium nitrativorans NL23 TaxID=1029756 RepID=V5SJG2_9HYPH|nr:hypothetical protein [Hyphomicrobium nitrativorans]AHB50230.1 hypothetical protein W911_11705 [Hyphomicrobium nitrativorans NL23]
MRKATTLGLLAAALIPLSLDQQSPSHAGDAVALPTLAETSEIHAKIQTILFTMERNGEIARSMQRAAKARERDRAALLTRELAARAYDRRRATETAPYRLDDSHMMAFTAERNTEIRRSLAAYRTARETRLQEIASNKARDGLAAATREAETLISQARATDEPMWTTLGRLAPLIASTSTIEPPAIQIATAKSAIETGSIEQPAIIGPCATPSP